MSAKEENKTEDKNELAKSMAEKPNQTTGGANEENSQSQIPVGPVVSPTAPLTMEDVGGINQLYDAYMRGQAVDFPPWIEETKDGLEICPQEVFIYIIETENIRSVKMGNSHGIFLYKYNKEKGVYEHWAEINVKSYIKSLMPIRIRKPAHWEWVYKELITEAANTEDSELDSDENIINFRNGVLDLTTGELLPHDPKYLSTIQIECDYVPNLAIQKAPVTFKFLQTLTGGNTDDMFTILEAIGVIISNVAGWRYKKLLILKGPGNTGKSVLREYVTNILGVDNCFTLDIAQLHSRFGASGIYEKRLVGSGDMKFARVPELDKIKELTGGDRINAEAKYRDSFSMQFRGFLWWNCNQLPSISSNGDTGEHVFERFLILSCMNIIPKEERDPQLLEKMLAEKEVIISNAVEHLKKTIKNGYRFTESERTIKNREEYAISNNSLALFLRECCVIGEGRTITSLFKDKYKSWCKENNLEAERPNDISKILINDFGVVKRKSSNEYYELTIK